MLKSDWLNAVTCQKNLRFLPTSTDVYYVRECVQKRGFLRFFDSAIIYIALIQLLDQNKYISLKYLDSWHSFTKLVLKLQNYRL